MRERFGEPRACPESGHGDLSATRVVGRTGCVVELAGSQLVGEVELRESGPDSGATALWIFRMGNFD